MTIPCKQCNKQTANTKFCSRSCSATYNNKAFPKRISKRKCQACTKSMPWFPIKRYCPECTERGCRRTINGIITTDCTLREAIYFQHHKSSAFALVRQRARIEGRKYGMNSCSICGYSKHIEISHKKPISSFSLDTKISIINSKDNIWSLCPNHHWEFDHGTLEISPEGIEPSSFA